MSFHPGAIRPIPPSGVSSSFQRHQHTDRPNSTLSSALPDSLPTKPLNPSSVEVLSPPMTNASLPFLYIDPEESGVIDMMNEEDALSPAQWNEVDRSLIHVPFQQAVLKIVTKINAREANQLPLSPIEAQYKIHLKKLAKTTSKIRELEREFECTFVYPLCSDPFFLTKHLDFVKASEIRNQPELIETLKMFVATEATCKRLEDQIQGQYNREGEA